MVHRKWAIITGVIITALGIALFFAIPDKNTYIAGPGLVAAYILTGGVLFSYLGHGRMYEVGFWFIAVTFNLLVYSLGAFVLILAVRKLVTKEKEY